MSLQLNLTFHTTGYSVVLSLAFLYISANPFIYAVKFDPVRRVLAGLMPCKKTSESADPGLQMTRSGGTSSAHN